MLEMKRLRLLWELRARGTVAAVAAALNYSPSAVSQQLALLEREAGVELLRKSGRTLEITAAGEALAAEAESLLAGLERAEAALHRARAEVTGTVRIAAFQTAMLAFMPEALRALRDRHPALRVEVVQVEPGAALRETWARGFDLVVAEHYPGHAAPHFQGLDREALTRDPIRLGLPPYGAGDSRFDRVTELAQLAELPWVMEPHGAATRHWSEEICRSAGFEPDVRYETADLQAHLRLIESGNAVALLPGLVRTRGRVRLLALSGDPHRTVFTAARASSGGHPALAAVRAALGDVASGLRFD
ncbi:LysR family transcriptional regulator [Leucobacter luti]|uniref:DNA-binding transcriptional LysR family regulator n=1 Tax=Leucobacter luti TaxID=340320 RepID=A0A4R6RVG6_9MICO|nr:LysR family transcriptional regulator [Leucobacter luti]MCW2289808.1 DNA-binding transcriptional LysR family regulator [Leucobacter luti]QYM77034.1 LysR family transcriptional regulator [Leucobacter luti]TCK34344.1 DNA-binding transcriptional LysR family regulator [Leucobacter luti]TDP90972.1 DNA-binding transcriptional LysR family regulator [Leucobacter luti]